MLFGAEKSLSRSTCTNMQYMTTNILMDPRKLIKTSSTIPTTFCLNLLFCVQKILIYICFEIELPAIKKIQLKIFQD